LARGQSGHGRGSGRAAYHYRFRSGEGEHYPPVQAVADYPDTLRWLWRGYTLPQ